MPARRGTVDNLPDRGGVFARVGALKVGHHLAGLIRAASVGQELAQAIDGLGAGRRDLHGEAICLFGVGAILMGGEQRGLGGSHFCIGQAIRGVGGGLGIRKDLLGCIAPVIDHLIRSLACEGVLHVRDAQFHQRARARRWDRWI